MRVLFVSFAVVLLDQISKLFVKGISIPFLKLNIHGMYAGQRIPVINGLFNISFAENPGIAFGIYPGDSFKLLICLFTLAASVLLFYYLYRNKNSAFTFRLSIAVIIGGALGNLIDRLFYGVIFGYGGIFHGRVVDFFNLNFFNFFLFNRLFGNYVFNVADMAVTFGVIMFLFTLEKKKTLVEANIIAAENCLADDKK